ncbi:hypothetical protein SDRG_12359 [Saprolegnia diclina VS20]|uniref:Secreted protein n=1 Tax=Saprolegnia diclina (strain VS20) TaxID=1156394 RepID=T0RC62_SAPDV|nr:hypothetical protein SDRG_12359 [Saprolegnia diclina VS20]EQC29813.1 hypothetical protein SDRG_12359 [Saprolegnia diclina VS20]|eukprot:XP_008616652.1 hypothetical protein SDRG_12359 [Saprolegnia diclina VS20]
MYRVASFLTAAFGVVTSHSACGDMPTVAPTPAPTASPTPAPTCATNWAPPSPRVLRDVLTTSVQPPHTLLATDKYQSCAGGATGADSQSIYNMPMHLDGPILHFAGALSSLVSHIASPDRLCVHEFNVDPAYPCTTVPPLTALATQEASVCIVPTTGGLQCGLVTSGALALQAVSDGGLTLTQLALSDDSIVGVTASGSLFYASYARNDTSVVVGEWSAIGGPQFTKVAIGFFDNRLCGLTPASTIVCSTEGVSTCPTWEVLSGTWIDLSLGTSSPLRTDISALSAAGAISTLSLYDFSPK